ncbi:MAG: hypothetical protein J2P21_31575 [Chloracidobacterium sp.]|nr:hypothetical protein [Chloracidobacterium sp.]
MGDITIYGRFVPGEAESSWAARAGLKLIRLHTMLFISKHLLVLLGVIVLALVGSVEPGFAQSVINGDATKPIRAVQRAAELAVWGTLAMGIFGLCWAGFNKTTGKAWGSQLLGGGICLGISGVIAFINSIVNGDGVDLPNL